jgi:hypothetical protein
MIEKKDKEIKKLKSEIENMKIIIQSYENQNLKITELEVKLRSQNLRHEKEMKILREKYEEKISNLNKSIYMEYSNERKQNISLNKSNKPNSYIEEEEISHENVNIL